MKTKLLAALLTAALCQGILSSCVAAPLYQVNEELINTDVISPEDENTSLDSDSQDDIASEENIYADSRFKDPFMQVSLFRIDEEYRASTSTELFQGFEDLADYEYSLTYGDDHRELHGITYLMQGITDSVTIPVYVGDKFYYRLHPQNDVGQDDFSQLLDDGVDVEVTADGSASRRTKNAVFETAEIYFPEPGTTELTIKYGFVGFEHELNITFEAKKPEEANISASGPAAITNSGYLIFLQNKVLHYSTLENIDAVTQSGSFRTTDKLAGKGSVYKLYSRHGETYYTSENEIYKISDDLKSQELVAALSEKYTIDDMLLIDEYFYLKVTGPSDTTHNPRPYTADYIIRMDNKGNVLAQLEIKNLHSWQYSDGYLYLTVDPENSGCSYYKIDLNFISDKVVTDELFGNRDENNLAYNEYYRHFTGTLKIHEGKCYYFKENYLNGANRFCVTDAKNDCAVLLMESVDHVAYQDGKIYGLERDRNAKHNVLDRGFTVYVYDTATGEVTRQFTSESSGGSLYVLDNKYLIVKTNKNIGVYDTVTGVMIDGGGW